MKAKRILAALISAALVICALPISAAADSVTVTVGGVDLTSDGTTPVYATTDSKGKVTKGGTSDNYNIKFTGSTLTLRNANIAGADDNANNYGIVINSANIGNTTLTITLEGSNTITAGRTNEIMYPIISVAMSVGIYMKSTTLTINGDGSLTTIGGESTADRASYSCGIYGHSSCNLIISGKCTVTAKSGKAASSYGVYCNSNTGIGITVNQDATLIAKGGKTTTETADSHSSVGIFAKSVTFGGKVLAVGGESNASNASYGMSTDELNVNGGTVIAYTLWDGSALSEVQPKFNTGSDYYWRTSRSDDYTSSSTKVYDNSAGEYVEFTNQLTSATVSVGAGYGGSIASIASDTFAVTADSGYVIDQLWIDGAERFDASGLESYTPDFTPTKSIFATFAYTVNFLDPADGSLTVRRGSEILSSGSIIHGGDVLTITANAKGYNVLDTLTVNGTDFQSGDTYTVGESYSESRIINGLTSPSVGVRISATFKAAYMLTLNGSSVIVNNNTGSTADAYLFAAAYNSGGKLVKLSLLNESARIGDGESAYDIPADFNQEGGKITVFLLDKTTFAPMCQSNP